MLQKTLHLSLSRHYTYHSQDTTPITLKTLHLSLSRHYTFIHFHTKMRNPTASLFRGFQPQIPHTRAHVKKHVKTACCLKHVIKTTRMTRYISWDFSFRGFLADASACAILFDFANAKTASANAYAFKLRCAFVHAR